MKGQYGDQREHEQMSERITAIEEAFYENRAQRLMLYELKLAHTCNVLQNHKINTENAGTE